MTAETRLELTIAVNAVLAAVEELCADDAYEVLQEASQEIDDRPCIECGETGSVICSGCNGSGEGCADGTRCSDCGGEGEVYCECQGDGL